MKIEYHIINTYSMKQPDLYYFETIKIIYKLNGAVAQACWFAMATRSDCMDSQIKNEVTSPVKFCMENTSHRRVFSVNLD